MEARPSLKGVLLDFDGTLVDLPVDWDRLREEISRLFAAHGTVREFRPLYASVAEAFEELEARGAAAAMRAGLRRRLNRLMTDAELAAADAAVALPGSRELLEVLRDRGLKTMIQTTNSVRAVQQVWERLQLPAVDAIVGRESARRPKPHPQGVRRALRALGLRGPEAVVVGDGEFDVILGRAIGATTVRLRSEDSMARPGLRPDYEAGSLFEVIELLAGERQRAVTGA